MDPQREEVEPPPPPVSPIQPDSASSLQKFWPDDHDRAHHDRGKVTASPVSPVMSRRPSHDSDRNSTLSGLTNHFPSGPVHARPPPAYVSHASASQVVSEHQVTKKKQGVSSSSDGEHEDEDGGAEKEDVQFSEAALALINAFLDQLLYSFLSSAHSTSLLALRPAVTDVLKHRLAREAISSADDELAELLAGTEEEEEMENKHKAQEAQRKWDLELVWKRTRLRVMVYIRLGEMEDDDEQHHVEREELFHGTESRFSSTSGLVSWSAAIFLTAILEYVAEQTLQVAGQAAHTRARRESRRSAASEGPAGGDVIVDEFDVEKIALNPALGRLWRTWRKALRNQNQPARPSSASVSRASRENVASGMSQHHRNSSFDTNGDESILTDSRPVSRDQQDEIPEALYSEHILAANIPLPMADPDRDIDEIAAVGLARDPDDDSGREETTDSPYTEHMLAPLVPLPLHSEQKDLDDLLIPGLARDPDADPSTEHPVHEAYPEIMLALLIAIPMLDLKQDVDEIEVPGLAKDPDAKDGSAATAQSKEVPRRKSFTDHVPYRITRELATPDDSALKSLDPTKMPLVTRQRSTSVPTPARTLMLLEEEAVPELPANPLEDAQDTRDAVSIKDALVEGSTEASRSQDITAPSEAEHAPEDQHASSQDAFPWMAAGAAVGAVAGAAGIAVAASLEAPKDDQSQSSLPNDLASTTKNANQLQFPSQVSFGDASQESLPGKDVEELDKRKSLLDMKSMMVAGTSKESLGQQSTQSSHLQKSPVARSASDLSYTLVDKPSDAPSETNSTMNGIGIAQTSDTPAVAKTQSLRPEGQQGKEQVKRPTELALSTPASTLQDSPPRQTPTPRTPRTFLDLTNDAEDSDAHPSPPPLQTVQLTTLFDGTEQGSATEKLSQHKHSLSRGSTPSSHKKQSSDATGVQEHPVVQKMASLKGSEPSSASGSERALPLTSAAIRGPEDFDLFVQGGETLKYTLTPEHVRDEPASPSSAKNVPPLSPGGRIGKSPAPREIPAASTENTRSLADKRRSIIRPTPQNLNAGGKSGLMAREPRVLTESTRDFADFIRSTGPDKQTTATPLFTNVSQTSLPSHRSAPAQGASSSNSTSVTGERPRSLKNNASPVPPVPPIPGRSKTKLQAREAKVAGNGSADLIDFIRSGPNEEGKHRISRAVAPFRTTMDSDQFAELDGRASADRQVDQAAASGPSPMSSSLRTSTNSRSALLNGTNGAAKPTLPAPNGYPQTIPSSTSKPISAAEDGEVSRKQYRNKDPYAIDFDFDDDDNDDGNNDEDDLSDLLAPAIPKRNTQRDESFLDFLRTHEPPSTGPPQPLIDPNSAQARRLINDARARDQGYVADLRARNVPGGPGGANANGSGGALGPPFVPAARSQAQIASPAAAAGSSRPTPSSSRMDARTPGRSTSRPGTSAPNTNALADFIRNSGPPDDPHTAPAPSVGKAAKASGKEGDKKKRGSIFGLNKKRTYLDLP